MITVKDDGVGIAPDKLEDIRAALRTEVIDTSKYLGLVNTNARIRLSCGEEYGLRIESVEGDGVTVTAVLPLWRGTDVSGNDN